MSIAGGIKLAGIFKENSGDNMESWKCKNFYLEDI